MPDQPELNEKEKKISNEWRAGMQINICRMDFSFNLQNTKKVKNDK